MFSMIVYTLAAIYGILILGIFHVKLSIQFVFLGGIVVAILLIVDLICAIIKNNKKVV